MADTIRILCFGDSNTWGWKPGSGQCCDVTTCWPGVLQSLLGDGFVILDDGVPGRTTAWDDPVEMVPCGVRMIPESVHTHAPLDCFILMLGTNDCKIRFGLSAVDIAGGARACLDIVRNHPLCAEKPPQIILVAPPPLGPAARDNGLFGDMVDISHGLASEYGTVAREIGCEFIDAGAIVASSDVDGVHWDAPSHAAFAGELARRLKTLFAREQRI